MDQELRGLNVIVRRHECTSCRHRFKTIEMEEAEFALLRKPKTMEARVLGQVRPGR
jgi:transcriptional regulator NrdR family protein